MKLSTLFFALIVLAAAAAQEGQPGPVMQSVLGRMQTAKLNWIETAEAMPAADYGFKLTPPQRSFAQWLEHNIDMNYGQCSLIHATPNPDAGKKFHGVTSKEELAAGLKASFEYCEAAFKAQTDATAVKPVAEGARKPVYPVNVMVGLVVNWNEHYGNIVGYLRTKGITPPTTARAQKAMKK